MPFFLKPVSKAILCAMCAALLFAIGAGDKFSLLSAQAQNNPLLPSEMNAARVAKTEFVIGDLGGVPVKIPHYFAEYVEYDGDPAFGEKRKGAVPERTYQSKLASFGFYVRYPDKAGRSTAALEQDHATQSIYVTTWINVGIRSGWIYPGDGFIPYAVNATLNPEVHGVDRHKYWWTNWVKESKPFHGLDVYYQPGVDPASGKPWRQNDDWNAKDFFVHRGKNGTVDAHITCSNRRIHSTPCQHHFSMEPAMKAEVYMSYRRGMLVHWKEIQSKTREVVLGFKTELPPKTTPPSQTQ